MTVPKKLAIYYGWPSAVNQVQTIYEAINVFNDYNIVVLGSGIEENSHPDHQNTADIIDGSSPSTKFYGYIDSTQSLKDNKKQVDKWCSMGGPNKCVSGILADRFGFDFNNTRTSQNNIVNYIHSSGLHVMVNAWNPDDVFSTFNGTMPSSVLTSSDWYLAQSHYVINGEWQQVSDWETKSNSMATYYNINGVNMACITTTTANISFDAHKWNVAYNAHVIYGFQASGWGEPNFSASDNILPWRIRPEISGTEFTGPLTKTFGLFARPTNVGICLNTNTHETSSII